MPRPSGTYRMLAIGGEQVRSFVPAPLPPSPPLKVDGRLASLHADALAALGRLEIAGDMIPDAQWFLYGFVRKEALLTSEIEGTQATLQDVVTFEALKQAERPDDAREVCNYVAALTFARKEIGSEKGLPLSVRLLCEAHKRLMRGVRGESKRPGEIRRTQNWVGGTRPGNARFVPPPPDRVHELMGQLERWIHAADPLPPLIRAGVAHVQFETIHPFLDGNGRIGRLLISLLLEHWKLLKHPLLYLSLALKRRQQEYYDQLTAVREGDWAGWTAFYLACVREAADDGVRAAQAIFALLTRDRGRLLGGDGVTIPAVRLHDLLPAHPIVTVALAMELLEVSKPTAIKAMAALESIGVLKETSGKRRDRVYAYRGYLDALTA